MSCCNGFSSLKPMQNTICCFFMCLLSSKSSQSIGPKPWLVTQTCVVCLFHCCMCRFGAKPNPTWLSSHRIVSLNFTKLDFIEIRFTLSKTNMEPKLWRFERWWFSFSKGCQNWEKCSRERCNSLFFTGPFKVCQRSWRQESAKSPNQSPRNRTSRRHTRKAEMECPPSSCERLGSAPIFC